MAVPSSFGIKCPANSDFYASNRTASFLGCCAVDPDKNDGGCPQDKLRPVTFDPAAYSQIPSQECMGHDANVMWYTCSSTSPPFLGCCAVNPCGKGSCPPSALRAARLSSDDKNASSFLGLATSTSSTATLTPTATSTTMTSSATPTASSSPTAPVSDNTGALQPATIAGIVVGITAGVLGVALVIFYLVRWRRAAAKRKTFGQPVQSPVTSNSQCQSPATPSWLYSASSTYPTDSPHASFHHQTPSNTPNPMPPDYTSLPKTKPAPVELSGSVVFELCGEESPHAARHSGYARH